MINSIILKSIQVILFLLISSFAFGYSSNNWDHIQSDHFTISYNEKTRDISLTAMNIAEETAAIVGKYFGYDILKGKISIVLYDHEDFSNGAAYRNESLIKIHCRKTNFLWRGETDWLRTVISHELSHIYSLRIIKLRLFITTGITINFGPENLGGSLSSYYDHNMLPIWFIEGIAQTGSYKFKADYRDPFREMLLRDSFYNDKLLSLEEMSRFEGSSREYELAYNQGFDLILYLQNKYTDKTMKYLCGLIAGKGFKSAVLECYGKSIEELYNDWKGALNEKFPIKPQQIDGTPIFETKKQAMTTEILSAANGKYAITNWRHDYNRFDLHVYSKNTQEYSCLVEDVGQILRRDEATDDIWFNRQVYNSQTGATNYDIYRLYKNGNLMRITSGKRCVAFDVKNDHLMYAAYKNGITGIILRYPDGSSQLLKSFNNNTAIYNISLITPDSAILSFGAGSVIKAGILNDKSLNILWADLDADVMDVVYAGSDIIFFVSTIDKTPQLYWCALGSDQNTWHKITDVSGGVRYPGIDHSSKGISVTCSIYNNGDHKIHRLNNPFSKKYPVDISSILKENQASSETNEYIPSNKRANVFSNIVAGMPYFLIAYHTTRSKNPDSETKTTHNLQMGGQVSIKNAPGNYEIETAGHIIVPFGYKNVPSMYPMLGVWYNMHIWQFRLKEFFSLINEYSEGKNIFRYIVYHNEHKKLQTTLDYQLFIYDYITTGYTYKWISHDRKYISKNFYTNSYNENFGTIYNSHIYSVDWRHYTNRSKFDPANLGIPYFEAKAGIDLITNHYPGFENYISNEYYYGPCTVFKTHFGLSRRFLFSKNRLSLKLQIDGFSYNGGLKSNKVALYMYDYIGEENLFSGYSYGSIKVRQLLRIEGELRFNPYILLFDKTHWFERISPGFKIEAGTCKYFNSSLKGAILLSIEESIRYAFYIWPHRKSYAFLKLASPLIIIDDVGPQSSQIYFGVTI